MGVIERALRFTAVVCSLLVVVGWGWFAIDETSAASEQSQAEIAGQTASRTASPDPDQELDREKVNSKAHEVVDDANDILLRPFSAVAENSSSKWVRRTVPALLALLVYGFGIGHPGAGGGRPLVTARDPAFGVPGRDFALGVEEELLIVEAATLALAHTGVDAMSRFDVPAGAGSAHPDTYSALIELASPVCANAEEGVARIAALRAQARKAGATMIGAGIHPAGAFGDVVHVDEPRYDEIHAQLRGLLRRTPTCALHVHVGMPDSATAIHVYNGLRAWLPLLQALAANSPFWHGVDSGLATARAQLFAATRAETSRRPFDHSRTSKRALPRSRPPATRRTTRSCGGTSGRTRTSAPSRSGPWTRSPRWRRSRAWRR